MDVVITTLLGNPKTAFITVIGIILWTIFKTFRYVKEGERGIKLRFGKAVKKNGEPKVIEPGFIILFPFVESLQVRHVRQQTNKFQTQYVTIREGLVYSVSTTIIFKVDDVYKALFEIDQLNSSLESYCCGVLRDILQKKDHNNITDTAAISDELTKTCKDTLLSWGVRLIAFKIIDCSPEGESARIVQSELRVKTIHNAVFQLSKDQKFSMDSKRALVLLGVAPMMDISNKNDDRDVDDEDDEEGESHIKITSKGSAA